MAEYISRDWLLTHTHTGMDTIQMMQTMIDAPAADVVEVMHGRWEHVDVRDYPNSNLMVASMWCPVCKRYHNEVYYYGNPTEMAHYCGFCGAKMDGGVNA